jgi:hypothetical protein
MHGWEVKYITYPVLPRFGRRPSAGYPRRMRGFLVFAGALVDPSVLRALKSSRSHCGISFLHWLVLSHLSLTILKSPIKVHLHIVGSCNMSCSHRMHHSPESLGAYMLTKPTTPPGVPRIMNQCALFWRMFPCWETNLAYLGASSVANPPFPAPSS